MLIRLRHICLAPTTLLRELEVVYLGGLELKSVCLTLSGNPQWQGRWMLYILAVMMAAASCSNDPDYSDASRRAIAQVDSVVHVGVSDSAVRSFLDREYGWNFESYPNFIGEVKLDRARLDALSHQGLSGRYVGLSRSGAPTANMSRVHVFVEVYVDSAGRVMDIHRELRTLKS